VAALHRAVAFAKVDGVAMIVREHLNFDMPGILKIFLKIDGIVAERGTAACEFIMDYLKTEAPFWKKETSEQGSRWVEARKSDIFAQKKWDS
jgi:hypothetical protein